MIIRNIPLVRSKDPSKSGLREMDISSIGIDLPPGSWRPIYVGPDMADIEVDDLAILKAILQKLKDIENRLAKTGL